MIGALIAGTQAAVGIGQAVAGYSKLKNLTRPEYQIPSEIEQNMSEAELMSYYGMPDAQKQSYMQNIQRSGQQALSGTADRKGGLGMVSAIQQNQQDSYSNLLSADVQQRMQNIQTAQNMRNVMAGYKDKAFQMNEMQPYQQDYAEAQGLIGAGMQNVMGGLQSGGQMLMLDKQMNALDAVNNVAKNNVDKKLDVNPATGTTRAQYEAAQGNLDNAKYPSAKKSGPIPNNLNRPETLQPADTIPYGGYKSKMDFTSYDNRVVPQIFPQGNMQTAPTAPMGPQPYRFGIPMGPQMNNLLPTNNY